MNSGVINPMCQIERTTISQHHCEQLQKGCKPAECFGCGSPCRLCAKCRNERVAFPEVEFCYSCLQGELQQEQVQESSDAKEKKCTKCQLRAIRYPEYNLCLCCAVSEYGPDRATSLTSNSSQPGIINGSDAMSQSGSDDLYQRAVEYTAGKDQLETKGLANALTIEVSMARRLMQRLEQNGVVSPQRGRWPRTVLKPSADGSSPTQPPNSGGVLTRILSPNTAVSSQAANELSALPPLDRQLISMGLELLGDRIGSVLDRLRQ